VRVGQCVPAIREVEVPAYVVAVIIVVVIGTVQRSSYLFIYSFSTKAVLLI
jgi:hypothetical protein